MGELTGTLVVLLGGDGAGKSSVLRGIREMRTDWAYASIDPADLYPLPGLEYMNWALRTPPRRYIPRWGDLSRASLLTHVLGLCYEERILPALAAGRTVVCDSYYYRVLAKERVCGSPGADLVAALGARMRRPDLVLWLEADPAVAWIRNGERCEAYESVGPPAWEGFRRLQEGVRDLIVGGGLGELPLHVVDGSAPLPVVTARVHDAVARVADHQAIGARES